MKKTLYIITAVVLIITFASCSGNGANNNESQDITSKNEISQTHRSTEDDVSGKDIGSKDNYTSRSNQSGIDNSFDTSEYDDSSIVSVSDDSSVVPEPDDSSNVTEPDDSSDITEPDSSIDTPSINDSSSLSDILRAILSNDNVSSLNGIMKNFVKNYLSGQDTLFIREFSSSSTRLFDLSISETSIINSAICVEPYEGPIEYCCYLIKLNEGTDKDKIKSEIFSSLDKNRWGCITAEKAIVIDSGNVILALMASEAETYAYVEAFKEVMGTTGTVLSK